MLFKSLTVDPTFTKSLITLNRLACQQLATGDATACVDDCTLALSKFKQNHHSSSLLLLAL